MSTTPEPCNHVLGGDVAEVYGAIIWRRLNAQMYAVRGAPLEMFGAPFAFYSRVGGWCGTSALLGFHSDTRGESVAFVVSILGGCSLRHNMGCAAEGVGCCAFRAEVIRYSRNETGEVIHRRWMK
jgi:hypothetical protein